MNDGINFFKFEIPEFQESQIAEELLDWIATVDEILEFKQVPRERCVPLSLVSYAFQRQKPLGGLSSKLLEFA